MSTEEFFDVNEFLDSLEQLQEYDYEETEEE